MPKHPNMMQAEHAKDFKGTMKKLVSYIGRYKKSMIVIVLFAFLSTFFSIIGPKILGTVTTEIFNGIVSKITGTGGIDFTFVGKTLGLLLAIYLFSSFCTLIDNYITSVISCDLSYHLRKEISEKLSKLPMRYFDSKTHGDILSRITNDVDTVSQNLSQSLGTLVNSVSTFLGTLVMMISISLSMTVASILILPISVLGMGFIVKRSQKFFQEQQKNLGNINSIVEEVYGGHDVMKVFNGEEQAKEQFEKINKELFQSGWKSQFISTSMHPLMNFVGNLNYVLISIFGGFLIIKGKLQVGDLLSFNQYIRNLNQSTGQLSQLLSMFQSSVAAAERVFEFLEEEEEVKDSKKTHSISDIKGTVTFDHVNFGYNEDRTIIHDFSASIKHGQKIAIVGPTGAGKTTMVKLLMRFYDVTSGQIKIDGINIKDFKRSELRSLFGMVLQDTWLYSDTIANNIRYGKLDASLEEVKKASRAAYVHHFIKTLPNTYDMVLNEESDNISQGQKQLLTIARVILADPKILILDEATSSVDTRTEILIQQAMDHLMEGRTSFIIAHRLSTIKNADLILVMNNGDIVESGNHKELLKKNGFYAKLYNSQFEEVTE